MNEAEKQDQELLQNRAFLEKLLKTRMPFGKFAGRLLIDLPEPYVVWFARQGFPKGELGKMMQILYEIKINGLEYLFEPLRQGEGRGRGERQ